MRLATLLIDGIETAALLTKGGYITIQTINVETEQQWPEDLFGLIETGLLLEINSWFNTINNSLLTKLLKKAIPPQDAICKPLYRHPRKIWGIGLNYHAHAQDLSEQAPTLEPASFMKPDTSIIGPGDQVKIPKLSHKTTAEAELGIIIGKKCNDISRENWLSVVAGFTTIIDMTAEDILRRNPRNLTQSKSFDTFFSFGPQLVTPDEIEDLLSLKVTTEINGRVHASNCVANMTFPPDFLVSYHSQIMTLLPGDIISTGTPGAVPIIHGDQVACHIDGFTSLVNTVIDLKQD